MFAVDRFCIVFRRQPPLQEMVFELNTATGAGGAPRPAEAFRLSAAPAA
jgi:hypothetical protein